MTPKKTSPLKFKISSLKLILLAIIIVILSGTTVLAQSKTCAYNPKLGLNPLGMRAFITITERQGNSTFVFEQFPSPVAGKHKATIAQKRELVMYQTKINTARQIMQQNKNYYEELVGYSDPEGFAPVNKVMSCR